VRACVSTGAGGAGREYLRLHRHRPGLPRQAPILGPHSHSFVRSACVWPVCSCGPVVLPVAAD
jgi:hypothetical protein